MSNIFVAILNNALVASWIILAVIVLRLLIKKMPKWVSCLMWGLVAVKLVIPFSIESIFSLVPSAKPIPLDIEYAPIPQIDSGIPTVNTIVNPMLENNFAAVEVASVNPMQVVMGIASYIWIVGFASLAIYALVSFVMLKSKIKETERVDERVYICRSIESPFILGIINPRIYLPDSMEEDAYACVLEHEKAHIKRGDFIWKPLGFLILAVYWFNPLCWVAYVMLCKDIEYACDERVTKDKDKAWKATYCQALLDLSIQRKLISACPVAFGEVSVKDRVKSVLNYKKPAFWIIIASIIICIIVGICFLTNPMKSDARLLEKASPSTSAMSLHYYDGEKTEIKWLYDQKEEQKIIDDINGLATKKVDSERIADFTSPCYGLEISDNDGYMIWLTYCDGLWLNKDGSVYEADFNFERLYNKISVASTQTIIGGAGMTNAGLLGEYDLRYYSVASEITHEKEGIRVAISSIKDDKVTLVIRNNSGEGFILGKHYSLQKEIDGVWYVLPAKLSNYAFTDIALELPNGESCEEECYLTMYGSLSDGHYRIEKEGYYSDFSVVNSTIKLAKDDNKVAPVEEKSIFAGDFTGYLDENIQYLFSDNYVGLDLDSDGLVDRVYREYISDGDLCNIELRFGDGSILRVENRDSSIAPMFVALPNKAGKSLIAYCGDSPGQCGVAVYGELAFYEKKGMDYVLSKVPFLKNSYDNNSLPQYMDVTVSLVDENRYAVGYSCKQIPDFYEEIEMTEEEYNVADAAMLFESYGNLIECTDSMFYRMETSLENAYVIECFAHILYHCDDEFMVGIQYLDDEWKIVSVCMAKMYGLGEQLELE